MLGISLGEPCLPKPRAAGAAMQIPNVRMIKGTAVLLGCRL